MVNPEGDKEDIMDFQNFMDDIQTNLRHKEEARRERRNKKKAQLGVE
jgi:hypothetical protein